MGLHMKQDWPSADRVYGFIGIYYVLFLYMFEISTVKVFLKKTDMLNKYTYAFRIEVMKRKIRKFIHSEFHADITSSCIFTQTNIFIIKDENSSEMSPVKVPFFNQIILLKY